MKISSDTVNNEYTIYYHYDNDGLLFQTATEAAQLALFRDPANGLLTDVSLTYVTPEINTEIATQITYNPFGEPQTCMARFNDYGGVIPQFLPAQDTSQDDNDLLYTAAYTRVKAGRIETKTETTDNGTISYTYVYDPAGRLYQILEEGVLIKENTYDPNGNRTRIERDWRTITATYDDQDRMLTFGGNSYTYTDNGELATKTNAEGTTTYQYDLLGNLKQVTLPAGSTIEYIWMGPTGELVKRWMARWCKRLSIRVP